jgi:hypothetical protein
MALEMDDLLGMSGGELDELFRNSPPGEIPNGDADGRILVGIEPTVSRITGRIGRWIAWQGKVFDRQKGELKNKVGPLGFHLVKAKVYKEASWFDDKETIVLDYSKTSLVARSIRDEIREVAPGLYLGLVFQRRTKVLHFALKFAA